MIKSKDLLQLTPKWKLGQLLQPKFQFVWKFGQETKSTRASVDGSVTSEAPLRRPNWTVGVRSPRGPRVTHQGQRNAKLKEKVNTLEYNSLNMRMWRPDELNIGLRLTWGPLVVYQGQRKRDTHDRREKYWGCTIQTWPNEKGTILPLPSHSEGHALKVSPRARKNHTSRSQTALNIAVLDFSNIDRRTSLWRSNSGGEGQREVLAPGSEPEGRSHRRPLGGPSLSPPGLPWPRPPYV